MKHLLLAALLTCSINASAFSLFESSEITDYGKLNQPDSAVTVDHSAWNSLLANKIEDVEGLNYFDYASFSAKERMQLLEYIESLESVVASSLAPSEQFAYWVNLYNAVTVNLILEHYPVESITDISFSLLQWGPWDEPLVVVEGRELTLNDIEHRILRPVFEDPRIHYVVNCASIGCPNLQRQALVPESLEQSLEDAARQFINHPRGVSVEEDELVLSKIFDWYADDFGDNETQLLAHLARYADADLKAKLESGIEVGDYRYDWSLNEIAQ